MSKQKLINISIITFIFIILFNIAAIGQFPQMGPQEEVVVATIDGEEVYMYEVEEMANIQMLMMQLNQMDPQFAEFLFTSPEGMELMEAFKRNQLTNVIAQKLLEREVDKEEISLSEEYKDKFFEEQIEMIKQQQGMTEEEMLNILSQQGIGSMEEFKDVMIQQEGDRLVVRKLIEEVVIDKLGITEEDARELYEAEGYMMDFEQVKDDIIFHVAREQYVEELEDEADIEIFEDEFGTPSVPGLMP